MVASMVIYSLARFDSTECCALEFIDFVTQEPRAMAERPRHRPVAMGHRHRTHSRVEVANDT